MRAISWSLQGGLARKLNTRARGISFILEHAAYSMNHLSQGADRKVPYERGRGKKQTVVGVAFVRKVTNKMTRNKPQLENTNARGEYASFVDEWKAK